MQIIEDDGSTRQIELWELEALEAAQRQHDDANGIIRQYSETKAHEMLIGMLANSIDIPADHACRMVTIYPSWKAGEAYSKGYRVKYGDELFTVLQDHTAQSDWIPTLTPSLYAKVLPGQQGNSESDTGEIGEWVQPDSTNPYSKNDKVRHNNKVWISLIDSNVWEPGAAGTESLWIEVN